MPRSRVGPADQLQGRPGLLGDLVQGAEDVRVVQLDRPHPGQPAEHPGQLRRGTSRPARPSAAAVRGSCGHGNGRSARGAGTGSAAAPPAPRRGPSAGTCRRCSATSARRSRTAPACPAPASRRAGSRPGARHRGCTPPGRAARRRRRAASTAAPRRSADRCRTGRARGRACGGRDGSCWLHRGLLAVGGASDRTAKPRGTRPGASDRTAVSAPGHSPASSSAARCMAAR